ncbi:O-methyltransferase [Gordonia sp. NPDC003429]
MNSTLSTEPVAGIVADLYDKAHAHTDGPPRRAGRHVGADPHMSAAERADAAAERYMAVSPAAGRLMYSLVRSSRPEIVVEFGMSYGISTLHLAAALRDNGTGHVYTTELNAKKIATAGATFADAGLGDLITILDGDAIETLSTVDETVGFVFLDGWKEMYLPVLRLLEPKLRPGTLILADNTESPGLTDYLERVRNPSVAFR